VETRVPLKARVHSSSTSSAFRISSLLLVPVGEDELGARQVAAERGLDVHSNEMHARPGPLGNLEMGEAGTIQSCGDAGASKKMDDGEAEQDALHDGKLPSAAEPRTGGSPQGDRAGVVRADVYLQTKFSPVRLLTVERAEPGDIQGIEPGRSRCNRRRCRVSSVPKEEPVTMLRSALVWLAAGAVLSAGLAFIPAPRRLSRNVLEDKVRGGWAGQMIGVSFGAPTEFKSNGAIIEGAIPWRPENVSNAIDQDDLYVEMTFAEVMDKIGLEATTEQYGEMFKESKYQLWHANAAARRLLNRGVRAPGSGHPQHNVHANDIDFQIESDFIGLMCPGLPREANRFADRVGRVMNHGDGLYGGMFFSGMYAAAFFESDPRKVVEAGLRSIPAESGYAKTIRDVLDGSARHPDDWKRTWRLITDTWDRDDPCPDGALQAFNIDARLNGAFVVLGLLYGEGDFAQTLEVSTRAGQDSDCNPSSAAGILGVILGYDRIPERFEAGIPSLADTRFSYTTHSFNSIVRSTLSRAYKVIESAGGSVTPTEVLVPIQEPVAPPLEQWAVDPPTRRAELTDPDWTFSPAFTRKTMKDRSSEWAAMVSSAPGAEATFRFRGTGVALVGTMTQGGGRADVYLDDTKSGEVDAYIVPNTHDNDLWHVSGLASGEHTVRVVTRSDRDPRSSGTEVVLERAIVYGR